MMQQLNSGKDQKRVGQWKLLMIFAVALVPLVVAAVMYFAKIGLPVGTTNHGLLILPPLTEEDHGLIVRGSEIPQVLQIDGRRKWLILILGQMPSENPIEPCNEACREALYLARQVNVALGKDADRVGRMLLSTVPVTLPQTDSALLQQTLTEQAYQHLSARMHEARQSLNPWEILIMDPFGNIMMHYPGKIDGRGVLDDLRRLLKVSKIG
ncbi:MAG: hypothetical protein IPM37_06605 [Hahellaceae bacterium]|nr:hypothetical protein [Hahellaceae bacterium]